MKPAHPIAILLCLSVGHAWAAHVDRWVIDDLTYDMTPTPERPVVHGRQISNGGYTSWEYPVVQPVPYLRFGGVGSGAHKELLALPNDGGARLTSYGQYHRSWPDMTSLDESAVSVVTVSRQMPNTDTHPIRIDDYDYMDVTIAREVTSGIPLTIRPQLWFGQYPRSAPREAAINMVATTEPTTYRLSLNNEVWGPWRDSYITMVGWGIENPSRVNGWDTFNFDDVTLVVGDGTEPRMDGDANMDGVVDLADLGVILRNLGNTNAGWHDADFDGSRIVDLGDLGIFLRNLGRTASPGLSSPVINPEPSTLGLLIVGGMLLGVRRC